MQFSFGYCKTGRRRNRFSQIELKLQVKNLYFKRNPMGNKFMGKYILNVSTIVNEIFSIINDMLEL